MCPLLRLFILALVTQLYQKEIFIDKLFIPITNVSVIPGKFISLKIYYHCFIVCFFLAPVEAVGGQGVQEKKKDK